MINIEGIRGKNVVEIMVSDDLTKDDYEQALPILEGMLDQHEKLHFLIKLNNFSGFQMSALWEDIKFDLKHKDQYGRIAIIGQRQWEEWGSKLSSLFFSSDMQFFYEDQTTKAYEWIGIHETHNTSLKT